MKTTFKPLSKNNWEDFVELFGSNGACGGCWCMWWRLNHAEYKKNQGSGNKKKMHKLVLGNIPTGIIAYKNKIPIGWCSISPRENLVRLQTSRVLKSIDEKKVWSINCFFIKKEFRKLGMSEKIIKEAVKFAKKLGAKIIEAYPIDTPKNNYPSVFAFTGFVNTFLKNGFKEVTRHSKTRPIVRKLI